MHSPIRRQLTLVVICTNLLGLGIVYATFELYERASFRRTLTGELSVLADTVATNSHVPLAFHEQKWAQDVLEELGAERRIVAAYLYTLDGQVLAQYRRSGTSPDFHVSYSESGGAQFTPDSLILRRTIFFKGKQLGSIAIVSDLTELQTKMRGYNEISALALLLSVFATLFISSRMLRLITEPILQLAEVAGKVSSEENYALRAIPQSNDEVGKLIQSFNGMLAKIQERDSKLKEINDDLELRVDARTQELQLEVEERVRAQETLSAERQVLRALIDNVPDHMYVKDTECRFLLANVSVARQMGAKTPEELIGKTDFDYYPRGLATTFFEDEQRVIRMGKAEIDRDEMGLDPQGNTSWVLTTQVPLRDKDGRVAGLVGIGHDITELKKIQAEMQRAREVAEAASRAKSEFLANMSHEIRTPLNGIMGMTDLALETKLDREQREYLETVKVSADSLLTVINDILDFSKIEAGKMDLEHVDFDVRDSLESALKTLAVRADEKGLELLCEVAPEVPEVALGDITRLRQVLLNLVGNAIKFTNEGEIAVKVRQGARDGRELVLHFAVSDTGIGIPKDKLEMIFDPFAQADSSTTRKYGGTGLGLTISSRLVRMMGGQIWVESEEGRGSHFHFTVRLQIADQKEIRLGSPAPPEMLRGVRVLVVDDNRTNLRILEGMLKRWEMIPLCVERGELSLAELASARSEGRAFGLIVADMHMPRMDGFELVEPIREKPELCAATIMMLTSAGHRGDTYQEHSGVSNGEHLYGRPD